MGVLSEQVGLDTSAKSRCRQSASTKASSKNKGSGCEKQPWIDENVPDVARVVVHNYRLW